MGRGRRPPPCPRPRRPESSDRPPRPTNKPLAEGRSTIRSLCGGWCGGEAEVLEQVACRRAEPRGRGQGGGLRPRPIRTDPAALLNNLYDPDDQGQPEQTQAPPPDHVADPVHAEVGPARPDGGGEHETGADQGEALPALPAQLPQ